MIFEPQLLKGRLIKRYKRFLADVKMEDGRELTVHCPNPGAMAGLKDAGNPVWVSDSQNPKRKLQYTLELMEVGGTMVGINTNRANKLALEAIHFGMVEDVDKIDEILSEQKYGENSRIDFLINRTNKPSVYLEVKNVNFVRQQGIHEFPDGVTDRGAKHLRELMKVVDQGFEAKMLYVIQRNDGDQFKIADDIDKTYGELFKVSMAHGIKAQAICCDITPEMMTPIRSVEILS
ncbi:MAG: DNA/RNA nuclease SfsA [Salaquimonas sp.]